MNENKDSVDNSDFEYNLILLGDSSVGKTCFFKKLVADVFKEKNVSTIGIDRRTFELNCQLDEKDNTNSSKIVKINLTDTAGQERYRALTKTYYKNSDGALILYDITERQTYDNIGNWIKDISDSINADKSKYTMFLLGTKIDLVDTGKKDRKVEEEEVKNNCKQNGLEWGGEISNKESSKEDFEKLISRFVKIIYKKIGNKKEKQTSANILKYEKKKKRNHNCC